jgi:RimJ/RimL family protein N-acetyltransferase
MERSATVQALISNIEPRYIHRDRDDDDVPLDACLRELVHNDWYPLMFIRYLPEFVRCAETLAPKDRLAWLSGMRQVWERHEWVFDISTKKSLLELAAAWSAWPLVIAVGESLRQTHRFDDVVIGYLRDAYHRLGDVDVAIDLAVALQLAYPARQSHTLAYRHLIAWRDWCDWRGCVGNMPGDDDLRLEPLGHHHVSDFAWQYYDPAIAELCCLPCFENADEWHCWLNDIYAYGDERIFAVIHRVWGFIGSVSLVLNGDIGFFSYWIGRDFQGYGFGPSAASLLLTAGHRHAGMRCCYTKVYGNNTRSRKALEKIGFEDLGICAAEPNNDQLFYRFGERGVCARTVAELHTMMAYLESDSRAAMPLMNVIY